MPTGGYSDSEKYPGVLAGIGIVDITTWSGRSRVGTHVWDILLILGVHPGDTYRGQR